MPKYNLVLYPDDVLRRQAQTVADVTGDVNELITAMTHIMYRYNGIGLAAPQVGYLQRIIIADTGEGLLALVNPQILQSEGQAWKEEGCLSLPKIQVPVKRKETILVRGIDARGREVERELSGLTARVVQHEIDHLNGTLIIDYASVADRYKIRDELEQLENNYRAQTVTTP